MSQLNLVLETPKLSVREVSALLRRMMRERFANVWVRGEVSGLKTAASGHIYFNLKEDEVVLPCVFFRQHSRMSRVALRDGLLLDARGSIDIYEARGNYQLLVEHVEAAGSGNLQQAFEELKQKLAAEGLFATERKRSLPPYPRRIGIVTSPTGAVLQDMLRIFERRAPGLELCIYPSLVQGQGAKEEVCVGIDYFSRSGWADFIIVARGGGSLEDLWTFNEEAVARAIAACTVPVVSAVGHETDFTIADFVADLRAPTPSAAAEMTVPANEAVLEALAGWRRQLDRYLELKVARLATQAAQLGVDRPRALLERKLNTLLQLVDEADTRLVELVSAPLRVAKEQEHQLESQLLRLSPQVRLSEVRAAEQALSAAMGKEIQQHLASTRMRFGLLDARLQVLSPKATLQRGYAIVRNQDGRLVREPGDAPSGAKLRLDIAQGHITATAD
jgi:exodeoxyribonuclease VII large subunit